MLDPFKAKDHGEKDRGHLHLFDHDLPIVKNMKLGEDYTFLVTCKVLDIQKAKEDGKTTTSVRMEVTRVEEKELEEESYSPYLRETLSSRAKNITQNGNGTETTS